MADSNLEKRINGVQKDIQMWRGEINRPSSSPAWKASCRRKLSDSKNRLRELQRQLPAIEV